MLPLVARNPAIDRAVSRYVLAQADRHRAQQAADKNPPIPLRDADMLSRYADLVLHEELRWSHPDKMSIVDYPIASERNERSHREKYTSHADLQYGDRRHLGRKKTHYTDDNGTPQVRNSHIIDPCEPTIEALVDHVDLHDALENADLTERQRQAIQLVFFENMTQEDAGAEMGVRKHTINEHIKKAKRKLHEYMTKT